MHVRWTRRRAVVASLVAVLLTAGATGPLASSFGGGGQGRDDRIVLPSGRAFVLHTPPALRRSPQLAEGRPAMIVLHPVDNLPSDIERSTGFDRLSDRDGVYVAYPEGVRKAFNSGLCCGDPALLHVDDIGFLSDVVTALKARGASRVVASGFSNGGMMAYRLACERPDLVDTIGVVSATLEIPHCDGPIRALHLHGALDSTLPVAGLRYSKRLRCFLRDIRTIPAAAPGSSITIRILPGMGHRWTDARDAVNATEEFWSFAQM